MIDPNKTTIRPAHEWIENYGPVLWHHIGEFGELCEAPIVAYGDWDFNGNQPWAGYYSYWSPLPEMPRFPLRSLMIAPPGRLICDQENSHVS